MNVSAAFALFNAMMGEPSDTANQRWTQARFTTLYNEARRWVAEETRCFEIRDSQNTTAGLKLYSLPNDVIGFHRVECDGIPLSPVRPEEWRHRIGEDDTLTGQPFLYKLQARQLQLFFVPNSAMPLIYEGWGYPQDVVSGGADTDLTDPQARCAVYRAVVIAKEADERDASREDDKCQKIAAELLGQSRRKGPRFVRTPGQGRFWRE